MSDRGRDHEDAGKEPESVGKKRDGTRKHAKPEASAAVKALPKRLVTRRRSQADRPKSPD
jgi:hypothetical protein